MTTLTERKESPMTTLAEMTESARANARQRIAEEQEYLRQAQEELLAAIAEIVPKDALGFARIEFWGTQYPCRADIEWEYEDITVCWRMRRTTDRDDNWYWRTDRVDGGARYRASYREDQCSGETFFEAYAKAVYHKESEQ